MLFLELYSYSKSSHPMMAAFTSKRRAVSSGENNSKNIGHKSFNEGERDKIL
jgi:hypothetical protein